MEAASATLERQQYELLSTRQSLSVAHSSLAETAAEVELLKEAANRSAEAAAVIAEKEGETVLAQSLSLANSLRKLQADRSKALAELESLQQDHQQVRCTEALSPSSQAWLDSAFLHRS